MPNPIKEVCDGRTEDEANEDIEIAIKKTSKEILRLILGSGISGEILPFALAYCAGATVRIACEATGRDLIHGTALANQTLADAAGVTVKCTIEFPGKLN